MSTILPDFLTKIRPTVDLTIQPVAPTKDVQEALSRLVSGQRVFAEILNALPNGTYRAVVSQREMVLALPFSAKTGDSIELQVVHNDGKVAFAVTAPRPEAASLPAATTTLSPAGQLISQLLGRRAQGQEAAPQPIQLAAGKPILNAPPTSAQPLAPALQQAIADSGVFFEAHQARWIDGQYPLPALLREPQQLLTGGRPTGIPPPVDAASGGPPRGTPGAAQTAASMTAQNAATTAATAAASQRDATDVASIHEARAGNALGLPKEVLPIVQQQLQSLESGAFVWHGQVWPGQTMDWEIVDDEAQQHDQREDGDDGSWKTRLRLRFPELGAVAAEIRLRGQHIELQISADEGRSVLEAGVSALRSQFEAAGLNLAGVTFKSGDEHV